jgi:hypothetical protein
MLRPAQNGEHVRNRTPTLLMSDEGEIDLSPSRG